MIVIQVSYVESAKHTLQIFLKLEELYIF